MTNQQGAPEALRLAEEITELMCSNEAAARRIAAAADELCRLHAENERIAALVEAQQPAKAESLRQILTDPENQPNQYGVEFGMSGQQMHFKIGNQLFRLAYEPDDQQEFEFMKRMLIHAFSTFTPDVKMAQRPAAHVQNHAEIEHVAGDVSKTGAESNMAQQPAPSAARPVTPYTCPKCHALWLHWPAEQTGFGRDTLNCRSADHCHYCEKAGVEQLQRLERVPAVLSAPQPSPTPQADSQPAPVRVSKDRLPSWSVESHMDAISDPVASATTSDARVVTPRRAARAPADSVTAPAASEWDVRGHLAGSLSFWHRLKVGEDDELVAAFRKWAPPSCTTELDELRKAFRPHDLTQEWTSEHSRNYPGKAARIINAASAAVLTATATPPAQAADSVLEDAAPFPAIVDGAIWLCIRERGLVRPLDEAHAVAMPPSWRDYIAVARKQGANHD